VPLADVDNEVPPSRFTVAPSIGWPPALLTTTVTSNPPEPDTVVDPEEIAVELTLVVALDDTPPGAAVVEPLIIAMKVLVPAVWVLVVAGPGGRPRAVFDETMLKVLVLTPPLAAGT